MSFDEILSILRSVATTIYSRVFITVDALDECQVSDIGRTKFLEAILNLQAECKTRINIFATSRFIPEIRERFTNAIQREIVAHPDDVRRYLDGHIQGLPRCVRQNPDLQDEIKERITNAVDGMFLLAKLYLDALKGKKSPKAIQKTLKDLPSGFQAYDETYDKAYEDAMERIEGQINDEKELAMQVIYWITCSKTPLTTSQLEIALAIERESFESDEDNICPVEDMVSVCAGLVTIDEESGIIRLVHYTAQQYFKRTQGKWFPQMETDMAAICCTYLSFDQFGSGIWLEDKQLKQREEDNVLYSYAAHNWGLHAREDSTLIPEVATFLEKQAQVEAASQSQLYFAAGNGQEAVVRLLLAQEGVDPESMDSYGQSVLSLAAENGHLPIVKLLLGIDGVDPNHAAEEGHEAIVKLLLAHEDIAPDFQDSPLKATALQRAAENGHEGVVRLLLAHKGVNPDLYGRGESALSLATCKGHTGIIQLLQDHKSINKA
ncbi:hypothetical protein VF21_04711 [Pseudogymnoascus sp. 05NY08]|nr:hypothetical protein VF21_04711 [Pseudogymnoascus sp. 05NY08]